MAFAYITEHPAPTIFQGNMLPVAYMPPLAEQKLAIGGAVQSSAFNAKTRMIGVHVDAICSILVGSDPTATVANRRLAANATEYFEVAPGAKISIITNT